MINLRLFFILGASSTLLAACSFKKQDRVVHEGKVQQEQTQTKSVSLSALPLDSIYQHLTEAKTIEEITAQLDLLEPQVMNAAVIENPKSNSTQELKTGLSYYNFGLLRIAELAPKSEQLVQRLERYKQLLTSGCDRNLKGCLNIPFFRADHRSSQIILLMVKAQDQKMGENCDQNCIQTEVKKYFDLLALAFEVNNSVRLPEMEFYYLKRAQAYGLWHRQLQLTDSTTFAQERDFFHRHGLVFEHIVSQFDGDTRSQKFSDFVKSFKPWTYSRLDENPFPFGVQRMFVFAANSHLYAEGKGGLNPSLKEAIEQIQSQKDKLGESFRQSLKNSSDPLIFQKLGVDLGKLDSPNTYNEYFFMVDRLFRGHLGLDEVNSIWNGSHKDEAALLEAVSFYVKCEYIKMIISTNQFMAKVFSQKNIPSDALFKQVISESESLTKDWGLMLSRMDTLSIFITQQLRNSDSKSIPLNAARETIDSVKRNTKFLSVYPNMLLLGYFMIDLNAPLKFKTWWGMELSVDPMTIMTFLLDGGFQQPWFVFGGDTSPLNRIEMIFAYYYALNTGAFETYSVLKNDKGLSVVDRMSFFRKALKKTMNSDIDELNSAIRRLRDKVEGNSDYQFFKSVCENEQAGKQDYSISMKLSDLQVYSLFGSSNRGLLQLPSDFYSYSGPIRSVADIRTRLENRLSQVRAMLSILKMNVETLAAGTPSADTSVKDLETEIAEIEKLKDKFLVQMVAQHHSISACSTKLQWKERHRQSVLMEKEIEHLSRVYEALTTLKTVNASEKATKVQQLKTKLKLSETESISADSYTYTELDMLNRFARFSAQLLPKVIFETPDAQTQDNFKSIIVRVPFINSNTGKSLSKDEFIAAGLTQLNSKGANHLFWLTETTKLEFWSNRLSTMASLYRLGFDSGLQRDPNNSISAKEIIDEAIELAKFVNIQPEEKPWMKVMGRRERIAREDLRGFLFEDIEGDRLGILDSAYLRSTNISDSLSSALLYYQSIKNMGSFLFPPPPAVSAAVEKEYKSFVTRSEAMVQDFDQAVDEANLRYKDLNLTITYRLEDGADLVYSPSMIDGGRSYLLDLRKRKDLEAQLLDFHNRKTARYFK